MKRFIILTLSTFSLFACSSKIDEWQNLVMEKKGSVGYSPELFRQPIDLPQIKNLNGKAKFIERNDSILLGYKVIFDVEKLDKKKLPEKFLTTKTYKINGQTITSPPIEEATFGANVYITFLDKDGFKIARVTSPIEYLETGRKNSLQNIISLSINKETIEKIKKMNAYVAVESCESCNDY